VIEGHDPTRDRQRSRHVNVQLGAAIREKRLIEFDYAGHHRVAEPHIYGSHHGVDQLLVYQVAGSSSSGGLPQWRRVDVHGMSGLVVLETTFAGRRPTPSGPHSAWDMTYEIVT